MAKRWVPWAIMGVLLAAAVVVAALTGAFGGRGTHDVAGRTPVSASPATTATPEWTPAPAASPSPRRTAAHRHHAAAVRAPAVRRRPAREGTGGSGAGQADPCAHNHHCSVPPLPPLKPDPRPPVGSPKITVTGAPVRP
jgi:hypothetical protein